MMKILVNCEYCGSNNLKTKRLLLHYQDWLLTLALPTNYFCVDGSSTLAIYGIREPRDLDYVHYGETEINSGYKEIGNHNSELKFHAISKDELIFNPENHFIINGYKFISIQCLQRMKENRGEVKDKDDIKRINDFLSKRTVYIPIKDRVEKLFKISYWKAKIKFFLLKIRYFYTKYTWKKHL